MGMGLPSMGGGRAPQPNMGAPAPQAMPQGSGAPQMGGGGDIRADLQALHAKLPPEFKNRLNPADPLTVLMYKRLRDSINEEEGQALLMLFGNADAMALAAAKKVWPEIMLLLDLFDDGEINDSVGNEGGGAAPGPSMASAPAAPRPAGEMEEDDEEEGGPPMARSRMSSVMG